MKCGSTMMQHHSKPLSCFTEHFIYYFLCFFFFNFTAQNLIPTTFEVDNVSGAAPSSDRLGGRIQFKRGRERGKKEKGEKKKAQPAFASSPKSSCSSQHPRRTRATVKATRSGWLSTSLIFNLSLVAALCQDLEGEQNMLRQRNATSLQWVHLWQFSVATPRCLPLPPYQEKQKQKKLYTGRIRVFPMFCTIGPIHYLLCRAKYKNKNKKSTKSARLLAIAPSSISTDQLLEKLRWQSMTHFPGLSVAF